MSAFFVQDAVIDDVVDLVQVDFPELSPTELGRQLYAMNVRALGERYGDRAAKYAAEVAAYEYQPGHTNLRQVFQSARCFLYQCTEGEVDKEELFLKVERAADALACTVTGIPDAEKAAEAIRQSVKLVWDRSRQAEAL